MKNLMTDDTARVEACLKWVEDYGDALNDLEIPPNGDDYNDMVDGVVSILRDGIVRQINLKEEGR